jgi:hypothetical protein
MSLENLRGPAKRAEPLGVEIAVSGSFCRAVYAPLTITGPRFLPGPSGALSMAAGLPSRPDAVRDHHNRTRNAMRIYGPNGTTLGTQATTTRRTGSSGFSLPDLTATTENRATTAPKATANIDALLALQGVEEDLVERRKRSVKRGRGALDVLDDLKIGLLAGNFDPSTVARLRAAAADLKSSSGDVGLDAVLSEIELRVEVELAKAGQY